MSKCIFEVTEKNIIQITFDERVFTFNINEKTIDATDLITFLSDYEEAIDIDLSKPLQDQKEEKLDTLEVNSLNFLYQLCNSFNIAYKEVYESVTQ